VLHPPTTGIITKSKLSVAGVRADGQFYRLDLLFNDVFDLVLTGWILDENVFHVLWQL
jgi:hypothetical protein